MHVSANIISKSHVIQIIHNEKMFSAYDKILRDISIIRTGLTSISHTIEGVNTDIAQHKSGLEIRQHERTQFNDEFTIR